MAPQPRTAFQKGPRRNFENRGDLKDLKYTEEVADTSQGTGFCMSLLWTYGCY